MLSHIRGVMGHYKGKVAAWDVVNEAVSIEGTSYRDCPFYKYLGEGYIDEAFKAAREADPDVKLYYNDYNFEGLNAKSDYIYNLVKGLVDRKVPIDGVGMQMHYGKPNDKFTIEELEDQHQALRGSRPRRALQRDGRAPVRRHDRGAAGYLAPRPHRGLRGRAALYRGYVLGHHRQVLLAQQLLAARLLRHDQAAAAACGTTTSRRSRPTPACSTPTSVFSPRAGLLFSLAG